MCITTSYVNDGSEKIIEIGIYAEYISETLCVLKEFEASRKVSAS